MDVSLYFYSNICIRKDTVLEELKILWLVGSYEYDDNALKIVDILEEYSKDS